MDDYLDAQPEQAGAPDNPEKDSQKTFLVNKEICPDLKPGAELSVTINRVLDSEYEISYEPKKEEKAPDDESSVDAMFA